MRRTCEHPTEEFVLLLACSLALMAAAPPTKPICSLEGRWQGEVVVTPGEYEVPSVSTSSLLTFPVPPSRRVSV